MARWGVAGNKGASNVQSVLTIQAAQASMRRAKVYDFTIGCGATPADNAFIHIVQRCTTLPTGASKTPNALDPADTLASTILCADTVTVDPTLTAGAIVCNKPLNQRATFRWVAAPYGELIIPAVATNGFMLGLSAVTTSTMNADAHYEEL